MQYFTTMRKNCIKLLEMENIAVLKRQIQNPIKCNVKSILRALLDLTQENSSTFENNE